jgi:hypothetical protein
MLKFVIAKVRKCEDAVKAHSHFIAIECHSSGSVSLPEK